MIAETIDPDVPGRLGLWWYEGTSQAAALATGSVVRLLAHGVAPRDVAARLQAGGGGFSVLGSWLHGVGIEPLDLQLALDADDVGQEVFVGLLPFLEDTDWGDRPRARVAAVDAAGDPIPAARVVASVSTVEQVTWTSCTTDADGLCTLAGGWGGEAWSFRIDGVEIDGVAHPPGKVLFATDPAEVLLASLEAALDDDGFGIGALAIHWPAGHDATLDRQLAEAWAVPDVRPGPSGVPTALLFVPEHLAGLATEGSLELDPDGTGLLASPLGFTFSATIFDLDGTGLLASPLGFSTLRLVGIDGSGLLASPLGFHASQLLALGGSGLLASPLGLGWSGQPMLIGQGSDAGLAYGGIYGGVLESGGLLNPEGGYEASAWLVATGLVDVGQQLSPATAAPMNTTGGIEWIDCEVP